jgi:hypothetical protein
MMMGNGSHVSIYDVGTTDLKLTLGKIMQLKNVLVTQIYIYIYIKKRGSRVDQNLTF